MADRAGLPVSADRLRADVAARFRAASVQGREAMFSQALREIAGVGSGAYTVQRAYENLLRA